MSYDTSFAHHAPFKIKQFVKGNGLKNDITLAHNANIDMAQLISVEEVWKPSDMTSLLSTKLTST